MEDIPDILGDINSCLPVADFGISDPEDDEEEGEAEVGVFSRSELLQKLGLAEEFHIGSNDVCEEVELPSADNSTPWKGDLPHNTSLVEGVVTETLAVESTVVSATLEDDRTGDLRLSSASELTCFSIHQSDGIFEADQGETVMSESSVLSEAPPTLTSPSEHDEEQWERFKADFAESLQGFQTQLHEDSHSHPTSPVVENLRQQLLIDAIAAMHSAAREEDENHRTTTPNLQDSDIGATVAETPPTSTFDQHSTQTYLHLDSSTPSDHLPLRPPANLRNGHTPLVPAGLQSVHTPLVPGTGLLSVSTLETIPELELEQLLESVEPETQVGASRGAPSGPPPLLPGFAWDVGVASAGSDDLMQQLEQLNEKQWKAGPEGRRDTPTVAGEGDSVLDTLSPAHQSGKGWGLSSTHQSEGQSQLSPTTQPAEDTEATVFLDLRATGRGGVRAELHSVNKSAQHTMAGEEGSSSSSEDDSDPYSWLAQRQQLKDNLPPSLPPSTTPSTSVDTLHNLHKSHKAPVSEKGTTDEPTSILPKGELAIEASGESEVEKRELGNNASEQNEMERQPRTVNECHKEQQKAPPEDSPLPAKLKLEGTGQHDDLVGSQSRDTHTSDHKLFYKREAESGFEGSERWSVGTSTQEEEVMKVSSLSSLSEEEAIAPANQIANEEATLQVERQRSGDSLTVSSELSSPSEGELAVVKPSTDTTATHKGVPSKPPAGKTHSKSKKAKKKAKKDGKGEDKKRGGKKRGGSSESKYRHRSDSLTGTSSEEESTPELNRRMAGMSGVPSVAVPSVLVEEGVAGSRTGGVVDAVDTERLKLQLQQRIESRKPPSNFETPAADPIFHSDVSFTPVLTPLNPAAPTNALLLLPLSEFGLASPPDSLAPPSLQAFHCLVLTWLASVAASGRCTHSEAAPNGCRSHRDNDSRAAELATREEATDLRLNHTVSKDDSGIPDTGHTSTKATTGRPRATESDGVSLPIPTSQSDSLSLPAPPFRITGMQQTILDGNPAIIVGVAIPQRKGQYELHPLKDSVSEKSPDAQTEAGLPCRQLESILSEIKLRDVLGPLLESSTMHDSISLTSLQEIEPCLDLPLGSIFSVQEDHYPLTTPASFYWHTRYHPSCLPAKESLQSHTRLQTTVCTLGPLALSDPSLVFTLLHRVYHSGLDLAGARLVFGESASCVDSTAPPSFVSSIHLPTLALAIRGPDALYTWLEVCGPEDSALAQITDPLSLSALFGCHGNMVHCVHTPYRVSVAIAKWFGGRACLKTGSVLGVSDFRTKSERRKRQRVRFSESESEDSLPSPLPDVTFSPLVSNRPLLETGCYSKICLVVSPHIPPPCYGPILACCSRMGYDVFAVKRLRLNSKRAKALQIPSTFLAHFTPSSTPPSPALVDFVTHPLLTGHAQIGPPLPSVLLVLGRENALLHADVLSRNIHTDLLSLLHQNPALEEHIGALAAADILFHTTEYTEEALRLLVGQTGSPTLSQPDSTLASWWEGEESLKEEIGFLAVTQSSGLQKVVQVLNSIYRVKLPQARDHSGSLLMEHGGSEEEDDNSTTVFMDLGGFELLGMKLFPQLSRFHAKQLCPLVPEDRLYQDSVLALSDSPALMLLFRGIDCSRRLPKLLPEASRFPLHTASLQKSLGIILPTSFSKAFYLASVFFTDKELFCDSSRSPLAAHIPPSWVQDADILRGLQREPEVLLSVMAVAGSQMKLLIKVLEKLSRAGFSFVAMTLHSEGVEPEAVLETQPRTDVTRLVVCVERVNAVWLLQHQLQPFMLSSETYKQALSYPKDFGSAVSDIQHYFPGGICCQATTVTREYGLSCPAIDNFTGLIPGDLSPLPSSPLLETTCVLLPLPSRATSAQRCITLLELTSLARFQISGLRLSQLTEDTAREICLACSTGVKAADLCGNPCLILVLRRDNAAACFKMIIKSAAHSTYRGSADEVEELLSAMVIPSGASEAKKVMALFQR